MNTNHVLLPIASLCLALCPPLTILMLKPDPQGHAIKTVGLWGRDKVMRVEPSWMGFVL